MREPVRKGKERKKNLEKCYYKTSALAFLFYAVGTRQPIEAEYGSIHIHVLMCY